MLTSMRSFLVLISGVAGSGKSTLARRLAPVLDLPLISKDTIKEALADSLGLGDDAWSQPLGAASFEVLLALLRDVPQTVLETSWHPERAGDRLKALGRLPRPPPRARGLLGRRVVRSGRLPWQRLCLAGQPERRRTAGAVALGRPLRSQFQGRRP